MLSVATTKPTDPTPKQPAATKNKQPPSIEAAIAMTIESMSWGEFHSVVGLDMPKDKSRKKADIALDSARGMGIPVFNLTHPTASGWDYNGDNKNFIVKHPKP